MTRIISLLLLLPFWTKAQLLDSTSLHSTFIYTSLEEALKEPDKVIRLSLRKQHLKHFPAEIFKFKNLQYLDLSKNSLKVLPDSIDRLSMLQYLDVSKNELEHFPLRLFYLQHLVFLNGNNNELYDLPLSIGNCVSLQVMDLWSNNLSEFPESMRLLVNLKAMDLRNILIPDQEQQRIRSLLPNTRIEFSPSCKCKW